MQLCKQQDNRQEESIVVTIKQEAEVTGDLEEDSAASDSPQLEIVSCSSGAVHKRKRTAEGLENGAETTDKASHPLLSSKVD